MLERFCENYLLRLRAEQAPYVERLSSGGFKTLDEYKFTAGKLKGLHDAESFIKETYDSMIEMKILNKRKEAISYEPVSDELY